MQPLPKEQMYAFAHRYPYEHKHTNTHTCMRAYTYIYLFIYMYIVLICSNVQTAAGLSSQQRPEWIRKRGAADPPADVGTVRVWTWIPLNNTLPHH